MKALHATRQALIEDLGEAGEARLQEIGYAAGEEVFQRFCEWLPGFSGVADPGDLDSAAFSEVLSAFYQSLGWGPMTFERMGKSGIAITSTSWAASGPEVATVHSCPTRLRLSATASACGSSLSTIKISSACETAVFASFFAVATIGRS